MIKSSTMEVKIKLINPKCMPVRMSTQAAGYDVFASKRKYMRRGPVGGFVSTADVGCAVPVIYCNIALAA